MSFADPGKIQSEGVRAYLDSVSDQEPGTKIQYGHPSPRFWQERSVSIDEFLSPMQTGQRDLVLYLHIPFCPPTTPEACGFCLFAREDFESTAVVRNYLDDLVSELRVLASGMSRRRLSALYFGGGTPNLLKPEDIRAIFMRVNEHFEVDALTEVTFEGTPALFTAERLETLGEVGVNRISVGAQVLDENLIRHSGRKQKREHVEFAATFCRDHGIHCSVDLITGWFEQRPEDVLNDIEQLMDWGVTGIVNHPLTLASDSVFSRNRAQLPDVQTTCRSFLAARERLLEHGFRADSYTDYRRSDLDPVQYLQRYRDVLNNDRLGLGYGANSLLPGVVATEGTGCVGHTTVNHAGLASYRLAVEGLDSGSSATQRIFSFDQSDLRLLFVLKGLEGSPYLETEAYRAVFGRDLREDFEPWWQALEERSWLKWDAGSPRLENEAVFYVSAVQRSLAEPRNAQLRGSNHRLRA